MKKIKSYKPGRLDLSFATETFPSILNSCWEDSVSPKHTLQKKEKINKQTIFTSAIFFCFFSSPVFKIRIIESELFYNDDAGSFFREKCWATDAGQIGRQYCKRLEKARYSSGQLQ